MKILLDECVTKRLKKHLEEFVTFLLSFKSQIDKFQKHKAYVIEK